MKKTLLLLVSFFALQSAFAGFYFTVSAERTASNVKLGVEFDASNIVLPVDITFVIEDDNGTAIATKQFAGVTTITPQFELPAIGPGTYYVRTTANDATGASAVYTCLLQPLLVSGITTLDAALPTVTLVNRTLKIIADYPVSAEVYDFSGRMVAQHGFDTNISVDMLGALHQSSYIIRITDRNNKEVLTGTKFLY